MVGIRDSQQLGALIRETRRARGLNQHQLAALAGVGPRFVSELEAGKPTAELARALRILSVLRIQLEATAREAGTTLDEAIRTLKRHRRKLRERGVRHVGIFGSTARGENRLDSDVDILVEYDDTIVRSLLDVAAIRSFLEQIIGRPVDVADREQLRQHVAPSALKDVVDAF
jgi:y4mF family transcriptional regulator